MYDDELKANIISSLESKVIGITDTAITLASQGYFINKAKYIKLDWSSILIHAFENIDLFADNQIANIERIYNKLSSL